MDYCDACSMCRSGWTNMCLNGGGLGTTAPGALAEYVAVNGARCEPLPDGLDLGEASLVEPLACVLHAVDRIGPVLGGTCWSRGAGRSACCSALLASGRARVDLVDRQPARLAVGAAVRGPADRAPRPASWTAPGTWWWTPPAVPARSPTDSRVTRRAGRIALLGISGPGRSFAFEPFDMVARELTVVGVNSVRHTFGRAARLLAAGTMPVDLLHEPPLPLAATAQALERAGAEPG